MAIKELNGSKELAELIAKNVAIVDFWAPWCGPCRALAPVFDELSEEYKGKLHFAKVNIEDHMDVGGTYGIQSIPCLILFSGGKEKVRIIGLQRKEDLKKKIDAAL